MADLIKISGCENPDRGLDLIFVHGLDGDGRSTWQKDDDPANFWPGWLGEDYPKIGIWSLNYEVNSSAWKGHAMPLYDRARDCLDRFDLAEIGHRPIGFVCHSLGGLLVKQMLRLAKEFGNKDWLRIADQTQFIVFLSTPHSGADMANWINHLKALLRTSVSIQELEAHNPQLLQLNTWFCNNVGQIKTYVYCETRPTHGILVVNQTSANPGIPGVFPIPLDTDHVTICKLGSKTESVFLRVKRLISETLQKTIREDGIDRARGAVAILEQSSNSVGDSTTDAGYTGGVKIEFYDRLSSDWRKLADLLEIKSSEQARWDRGDEARAIWEWLELRNRLTELPDKLREIDRYDLAEEFHQGLPSNTPKTADQEDGIRTHTLRAFYQGCIDRWSAPRYALDTRFVDLTLLLDQGAEAQGPRWQAKSQSFQNLQEVLNDTTDPLVILGAPGCGKSTLLRHFELENAQGALAELEGADAEPKLTFFIQLNDFKGSHPGDPPPQPLVWLSERWAQCHPNLPDLPALLKTGRIMLLLDALNEIPYRNTEVIQLWKDFLSGLESSGSTSRVVFSCRSLDYSAPLSTKDRPVQQVRIESLSDDKVRQFLLQYSPLHGEVLWANLSKTAQLNVFRSPYFLKMLIEESVDGEIPSGRAALFTAFVRRLIVREIENPDNTLFQAGELLHERDIRRLTLATTGRTPYELPKRGLLIRKLSLLAFQMQKQSQTKETGLIKIGYDQALALLDHHLAEKIIEAGAAMSVLEQDLAQDQVFYLHQLLQEYFAAQCFAEGPEPQLAQQAWQADVVSPSLQETLDTLPDSDPLPPLPATGWEETLVLATAMFAKSDEFVTQLMTVNLALAGRCAAQPDVRISEALKSELQGALLERTQNPQADLRARIAAGFSLGELGDPRFQKRQGPDGEFLVPPLIGTPGGIYPIGSDEGLYEDEAPQHSVSVSAFQIGQFPVTNAEWHLFMAAGGYEDERWWQTDVAKAWRLGENTNEGTKQQWREHRKLFQDRYDEIREWQRQGRITSKQADDWEQIAQWTEEAFEQWLAENFPGGRLTEPAYWHDDAFNRAAQPVVGICWYEAQAYCVWLNAQSGLAFRLPTEAEWEAAARGSTGRRYAYGNAFDVKLANTFESHIRATTPIGVFPGGITPEGLYDMTGNVWEWTSSLLQTYPYDLEDGRENPQIGGRRVVRGGSWGFNQVLARTAFRLSNTPVYRDYILGFRLVCSSPIL